MEEQINAAVETPSVEVNNEVSQTEDVSQSTTQEEVSEEVTTSSPNEQQKESDSHRPTRSERRIQQLSGKIKELSEPAPQDQVFGNQLPPWWQQPQAESNDGELTMEQLNQKMMTVANLAVARDRQEQQFKQTVSAHQSEFEELVSAEEFSNKEFDENFTKLYATMNYDESGAFKPKMTPKQVYQTLVGVKTLGKSEGQTEASNSMARTIANAAVTPSASRPDNTNEEHLQKLQHARRSGSTEDWARVLKDIL